MLDAQKRTCLHYAAMSGSLEAVKTILDYREKLVKENRKKVAMKGAAGSTLRPRASTTKLRSIIQEAEDLLTAVDQKGKTALMFAVECGSEDISRLLMSAGSGGFMVRNL